MPPRDSPSASMTGVWTGLYSYPKAVEPVGFTSTLVGPGASFWGTCDEVARDPWGRAGRRGSSIAGILSGQAVTFEKRYDGRGGWTHAVAYQGTLAPDGSEVWGTWTIPGNWSGRFLMVRGARAEEAALREAFERA